LRRIAIGPATSTRRTFGENTAPRWSLVDRLGAFLFESPLGVVVVDRNYDISTINQAARSMLGIHGQGIGEDLVHLAEVPSGDLKAALDAAFRNESSGTSRQLEAPNIATNQKRVLNVSCYPDRTLSKEGRIEGVFVLVADVTEGATQLQQLRAQSRQNEESALRLATQNAQLQERQRALAEANDELTSANAELRTANEHLLISAEEAEAASEEVETLNEEMQATSEELETLNEELHATVEELNTTNEELGARTADLERAAKDRQNQLDNANAALSTLRAVVSQLPLIVCIVDRRSTVALASERYMRLSGTNDDLLPPIGEKWRLRSEKVTLHEDGTTTAYGIVQIPLPENGGEAMLLLTPLT
ncbi:MAG: PAS domain-containing protein, partial [Candidatus Eremiobacteraeota bacterium]|nr:PAS domain-containing protein [Candidatus Eremiobacteraeota bacterium]